MLIYFFILKYLVLSQFFCIFTKIHSCKHIDSGGVRYICKHLISARKLRHSSFIFTTHHKTIWKFRFGISRQYLLVHKPKHPLSAVYQIETHLIGSQMKLSNSSPLAGRSSREMVLGAMESFGHKLVCQNRYQDSSSREDEIEMESLNYELSFIWKWNVK